MAESPKPHRISIDSVLQLGPGVELLRLPSGEAAIVSDLIELRLAGASAQPFTEKVLARLDGINSLDALTEGWSSDARAQAIDYLERLVDQGAVQIAPADAHGRQDPLLAMLDALGVGASGRDRLSRLRVGVVGAEGHGAQAAVSLTSLGVRSLVLVDPFPTDPGDLALWPALPDVPIGRPRQAVIAELVTNLGGSPDLPIEHPDAFDKATLRSALDGCDLLVHAFDRGHASSAIWVNEHALATGVPAVFSRLSGHVATAGPLVFPGESACYLCSRMRSIANAEDFEVAIATEEELDKQRHPRLAGRPGLPPLATQLGALVSLELMKVALAVGQPSLVGRIVVIDSLAGTTTSHPVLQHPDCPACRSVVPPTSRGGGGRAGSESRHSPPGSVAPVDGIASAERELVSERTGIVRRLSVVPKDPTEPAIPIVLRAELANHRYVAASETPFETCSGKGLDLRSATISALGEACERYSGARIDPDRLTRARRDQLDVASVDPVDLVLYAPEQYPELPYAPWEPTTQLDWVVGTNLATGEPTAVPALSAFMHYAVHRPEEYLFPITSNGLAGGSSPSHAALAAILEVIERDAFVIAWLQRLPGRKLAVREISPEVRRLAEAYERRGVGLTLIELPTGSMAVAILALATQDEGDGPAAVVGLGCALDRADAALKAVLEIGQIRPALKGRLRNPEERARLARLLDDPGIADTLEDHDLLYADRSMLPALSFWRHDEDVAQQSITARPSPDVPVAGSHADQLGALVGDLASAGSAPVVVDLSTPDMARLGIHAARAIVPRYQPIHFGAKEARLGGTRLYDPPHVPAGVALARRPLELNLTPHPLS